MHSGNSQLLQLKTSSLCIPRTKRDEIKEKILRVVPTLNFGWLTPRYYYDTNTIRYFTEHVFRQITDLPNLEIQSVVFDTKTLRINGQFASKTKDCTRKYKYEYCIKSGDFTYKEVAIA